MESKQVIKITDDDLKTYWKIEKIMSIIKDSYNKKLKDLPIILDLESNVKSDLACGMVFNSVSPERIIGVIPGYFNLDTLEKTFKFKMDKTKDQYTKELLTAAYKQCKKNLESNIRTDIDFLHYINENYL